MIFKNRPIGDLATDCRQFSCWKRIKGRKDVSSVLLNLLQIQNCYYEKDDYSRFNALMHYKNVRPMWTDLFIDTCDFTLYE